MTRVEVTPHLYRYFPQLEHQALQLPAGSVAEILQRIDAVAPGFTDYLLDDQGALRRHVLLAIEDTLVIDRRTLADRVHDGETLYIFQALTGG